jgi:hypothetical protein
MPWPLKNREICIKIGTFLDPYNKACFSISRSVPEGETFLEGKAPGVKKGL